MRLKKIFFPFFLSIAFAVVVQAQSPSVEVLTSGTKTSLRGLSVVNDNVVWVSGSGGKVGKSLNGGKNWNWYTVSGFEKTEFRDIEAFDANTAIIMGIAEPAYILKTSDGGETWKVVYENKTKGMFLDAMDFANEQYGIVIGDPINNKPFLAETNDGGNSWTQIPGHSKQPVADSGEAFFAASGTNIRVFNNHQYYAVSGGMRSRILTRGAAMDLPLIQGKETTGGNSIDIFDLTKKKKKWVVVGGDFNTPDSSLKNCFYSTNAGKTWKAPKVPPHGYRSCVEYLSEKDLLACGINGVDYSFDGGKTWTLISKEGFNTCRIAKIGRTVFLAGNNGKVARLNLR